MDLNSELKGSLLYDPKGFWVEGWASVTERSGIDFPSEAFKSNPRDFTALLPIHFPSQIDPTFDKLTYLKDTKYAQGLTHVDPRKTGTLLEKAPNRIHFKSGTRYSLAPGFATYAGWLSNPEASKYPTSKEQLLAKLEEKRAHVERERLAKMERERLARIAAAEKARQKKIAAEKRRIAHQKFLAERKVVEDMIKDAGMLGELKQWAYVSSACYQLRDAKSSALDVSCYRRTKRLHRSIRNDFQEQCDEMKEQLEGYYKRDVPQVCSASRELESAFKGFVGKDKVKLLESYKGTFSVSRSRIESDYGYMDYNLSRKIRKMVDKAENDYEKAERKARRNQQPQYSSWAMGMRDGLNSMRQNLSGGRTADQILKQSQRDIAAGYAKIARQQKRQLAQKQRSSRSVPNYGGVSSYNTSSFQKKVSGYQAKRNTQNKLRPKYRQRASGVAGNTAAPTGQHRVANYVPGHAKPQVWGKNDPLAPHNQNKMVTVRSSNNGSQKVIIFDNQPPVKEVPLKMYNANGRLISSGGKTVASAAQPKAKTALAFCWENLKKQSFWRCHGPYQRTTLSEPLDKALSLSGCPGGKNTAGDISLRRVRGNENFNGNIYGCGKPLQPSNHDIRTLYRGVPTHLH